MKNSHLKIVTVLTMVILLFSSTLLSDTLYTVDNNVYEGKLVAFKYGTIYFNIYKFGNISKTKRFPLFKVHKIVFNPKEEGVETSYEIEQTYKRMRRGKRSKIIYLSAQSNWKNSNIKLKKNQTLLFSINGSIRIFKDHKVYQDGELNVTWNKKKQLPTQPTGAVIAKIGEDGIPFYVGNNKAPFIVKKSGYLYLGINDYNFKDNSGEFIIKIFY